MKSAFLPAYLLFIFLALALYTNGQGGPLPLNSNVSGNLSSSTPDVWDITTTADGLLRLTFTTTSPADLYMTLYDNDGTTVIGGTVESYNNSTVSINADGLLPGTYHVKITPYSTAYGLTHLPTAFLLLQLPMMQSQTVLLQRLLFYHLMAAKPGTWVIITITKGIRLTGTK